MLNHLKAQEEAYWVARSRIRWLQAGDSNTIFFHQSTVLRRHRNKISRIRNEEGIWQGDPAMVRRTVDDHFKNLFMTEGP